MKRLGAVSALVFMFCFMLSANSFAAKGDVQWKGSGGWGVGTPYTLLFNSKSVETIKGTVESVDTVTPMQGMTPGVSLTMRTEKGESLPVQLGPAWYVENQDVKLQPNENIEVRGSRVTSDSGPVVIAQEIRKGDETFKLRDDKGQPMWSAWKKR